MKRHVDEPCLHVSSSRRTATKALSAFVAGLVVAMSASSARAQGGTGEHPSVHSPRFADESRQSARRWYGYQTVISDVLSTSLLFAGAASMDICISPFGRPQGGCHNEVPTLLILGGMAGYIFGGPVIHAAHGHWNRAAYSLGLRVVPVAAAIGIGAAFDAGESTPWLVGGTVLTAMVLDSALLGYETVALDKPKVSVAPSYDPRSRGGSLVLTGTF